MVVAHYAANEAASASDSAQPPLTIGRPRHGNIPRKGALAVLAKLRKPRLARTTKQGPRRVRARHRSERYRAQGSASREHAPKSLVFFFAVPAGFTDGDTSEQNLRLDAGATQRRGTVEKKGEE
jgi:hypothetical protein